MDSETAFGYVYAKASGMLAKSFSDKSADVLFSAKSLGELWSLIFPNEEVPAVPETLLAKQIESHAQERFVSQFSKLIKCFDEPSEILTWLLRSFDIDDWKSLKNSAEGFDFPWKDELPHVDFKLGMQEVESVLDKFYAKKMYECAKNMKGEGCDEILNLVRLEFSLRNIVWALRLKVYYKMEKEEIIPLLAYAEKDGSRADPFAKEAISILERDVERFEDWTSWKYSDCLNSNEDGGVWKIDPRWVERKMSFKLNDKVRKGFHKYPATAISLYSWFKIKKSEVDYIRKAAEALRLGVEGAQNV